MRSDEQLYTGVTTKGADKIRERRLKVQQAKEAKRAQLVPKADVVIDKINDERATIAAKVLEYINADRPEEDVKASLLAIKMYDQYLKSLTNQLGNILRAPEKEEKE